MVLNGGFYFTYYSLYKEKSPIRPFTYKHMSINSPMNNKFQANHHQLVLECAKFEKLVIEGVMEIYMKNLGCSSTSDAVDLEFILVQIHLIASD